MDSGLRRNDDEQRTGKLPSRQPLCYSGKNPNRNPTVIPACLQQAGRNDGKGAISAVCCLSSPSANRRAGPSLALQRVQQAAADIQIVQAVEFADTGRAGDVDLGQVIADHIQADEP